MDIKTELRRLAVISIGVFPLFLYMESVMKVGFLKMDLLVVAGFVFFMELYIAIYDKYGEN